MSDVQSAAAPAAPAKGADKAGLHRQLDALAEAVASGAHEHEAHKVERLRAHVATLHMCIDEIHGGPNVARVYTDLGNGRHEEAAYVVDDDGSLVEKYDPAKHGGNA